ncbi:hypothetical protein VPH35_063709 [Triticum aestivum]
MDHKAAGQTTTHPIVLGSDQILQSWSIGCIMGKCTKQVHALLLLLLVCFTIHGQFEAIGVNGERIPPWCTKSATIPICNPDKYRCYCCVQNWQCYKTMDECRAKCAYLPPSSSSVLP